MTQIEEKKMKTDTVFGILDEKMKIVIKEPFFKSCDMLERSIIFLANRQNFFLK